MGDHIINGQFQSDKYPKIPRGLIPFKATDPMAQDLLWEYARRREQVDAGFAEDLRTVLLSAGYEPDPGKAALTGAMEAAGLGLLFENDGSPACERCKNLRAEVVRLRMDALTGLAGRDVFDHALETGFARAHRAGRPFGVILIDVDHFKKVNDERGHLVGDQVLFSIAQSIRKSARAGDVVARYGGDEFVVIAEDACRGLLWSIAERMRSRLGKVRIKTTVSVGFAIQNPADENGWAVLARADAALYRAKRAGRNRVVGDES